MCPESLERSLHTFRAQHAAGQHSAIAGRIMFVVFRWFRIDYCTQVTRTAASAHGGCQQNVRNGTVQQARNAADFGDSA